MEQSPDTDTVPNVATEHIERRIARNGKAYSYQQFRDYYGKHAFTEWLSCTPAPMQGNVATVAEIPAGTLLARQQRTGGRKLDQQEPPNEGNAAKLSNGTDAHGVATEHELDRQELSPQIPPSAMSSDAVDTLCLAPYALGTLSPPPGIPLPPTRDPPQSSQSQLILLRSSDIPDVCSQTRHTFEELHRQARKLLTTIRSKQEVYPAFGVDLITALDFEYRCIPGLNGWTAWQEFLALHAESKQIIGAGVTKFTAEYIPTTMDPNNIGRERLDFHVYRHDGSYCRIHPGSQKDAHVYYFCDCNDRPHAALPFAQKHARMMPQWDKLGRKSMWHVLQQFFRQEQPAEITSVASPVPWRLWFSNLGHWTEAFIGTGINRVVVRQAESIFIFTIERVDGSVHELALQKKKNSYDFNFEPELDLQRQ